MTILTTILLNIIFPVFALMGAGIFFHRKFNFDVNTLSKITMYYLLPVVGFVNIYKSSIDGRILLEVIGFQLVLATMLMVISSVLAKVFKLDKGMTSVFKNSIVLMNSGNYGLPVSQLVFQTNPLGLTIQIIVMLVQNFITYTYGLINSISVRNQGSSALVQFLKMPMLYALIAGLLFQALQINIPEFLWNPLTSISNAFLTMALFTLGVQVAYIKLTQFNITLTISSLTRLVLSPVIALGIILLIGLDGTTAQALFIASAFPASRNSAQFALEYNTYPEQAGQIVLFTTMLSAVTVTCVVYLSGIIF